MQSNGNDPFLSLFGIDLNENQIGSEEAARMLTNYTLELIGEESADNNRLIQTAPTLFSSSSATYDALNGPVAQSTAVGSIPSIIQTVELATIPEIPESENTNNQM